MQESKSETFIFRMPANLKRKADYYARKIGINLSEFMRQSMLEKIVREEIDCEKGVKKERSSKK